MVIGAAVASMAVAANAWTVPDETLRYSVNFKWGLIDEDGERQAQKPYQQKPRLHGIIRTQFSQNSKSWLPQHTRKARCGFKFTSHETDRGI